MAVSVGSGASEDAGVLPYGPLDSQFRNHSVRECLPSDRVPLVPVYDYVLTAHFPHDFHGGVAQRRTLQMSLFAFNNLHLFRFLGEVRRS